MNATVFFRVAVLAAFVTFPLWAALRAAHLSVAPIVLFAVVITACSLALRWHFGFIYRLRLVLGEPDRALRHFAPWRLLLSPTSYWILRAQILLQAGRLDELSADIARLEVEKALPPWLLFHLRAQQCKAQDRYVEAIAAMERGLAVSPPIHLRAPFLADLARMVAERIPARIAEARAWIAEAKILPAGNDATRNALVGIEGIVLVESGDYQGGYDRIEAAILALSTEGSRAGLLLGMRAELLRGLGRAKWGLGDRDEARKFLEKARATTKAERLHRTIDEDLEKLARGETLHGDR